MKKKSLFQNLLLAAVSLAIVLLAADFAVRQVNGFHYRRAAAGFKGSPRTGGEFILINSRWFRSNVDKRALDGGKPLVLFVGDSIALGYSLKTAGHAYPELFGNILLMLPGAAGTYFAGNISGLGANTSLEALAFRHMLGRSGRAPELLAVGYCLNDIFFSIDEENRGLVPVLKALVENRKTGSSGEDVYSNYYSREKNRRMVKAAFSDIASASGSRTKTLVAIFPFFLDSKDGKYPYLKLHEQVASYAENAGLDPLDLYPFFAEFPLSSFTSRNDTTHPGPLGHKFAADAIYWYIATRKILPFPEVASIPGLKRETRMERAGNFCESLFAGEIRFGFSSCERILQELISEGRIFSGTDPGFFMIDWQAAGAEPRRMGRGDRRNLP